MSMNAVAHGEPNPAKTMTGSTMPNGNNTNGLNADTMTNNLIATVSAASFDASPDSQAMEAPSPPTIAAQESGFANMPRELLDFVASLLATTDFNNLRLACKSVENKLFPYWSNAFFKKKQFMITAFSLQTLVDISRHATLGPCITHLVFGLDHFKTISRFDIATLEEYEQCQDASDLQESLLDTGAALQLLTTAFLNLRNLNNIDIRDFNSNTRYRDYNPSESVPHSLGVPPWTSYGHSEVGPWSRHLNTRRGELIGEGSLGFVNRVFKVLLTALGRSERPIRGLEVLFRNRIRGLALTNGAFTFTQVLDNIVSKLPVVLAGLTKLHLDVYLDSPSLPKAGIYHYEDQGSLNMPKSVRETYDPLTRGLRNFLALTPNITWLRLNSACQTYRLASGLLSWLALDPEKPFGLDVDLRWHGMLPKPVSPPLRRLDIMNMELKSETLVRILEKFGELEWISLCLVRIRADDAEHDDDYYDADDKDHGNGWAKIFRSLPILAPNLKHLLLRNLGHFPKVSSYGAEGVIFAPADADDWNIYSTTLELSVADKTSLENLADRTWGQTAWDAAHQIDHSSGDDDGMSMGSGAEESIAAEPLDESNEDDDEDELGH